MDNINHYERVHNHLSALPEWEQGIPWQISNQISNLSFQMSVPVYSVPGQTEGRRKVVIESKIMALSSKLSLICGGKFILFLICLWEQETNCQLSKQISKLSFQLSVQVYYLLAKLKERGRPFMECVRSCGAYYEINPKSNWLS